MRIRELRNPGLLPFSVVIVPSFFPSVESLLPLQVRDARFKAEVKEWEDAPNQRVPRFVERFRVLFEDFRGGRPAVSESQASPSSNRKWADGSLSSGQASFGKRHSSRKLLFRQVSQASFTFFLGLRQACGG